MSGRIVIPPEPIVRPGLAVDDMAAAVRRALCRSAARFLREGMIFPVTRAVKPPDLREAEQPDASA